MFVNGRGQPHGFFLFFFFSSSPLLSPLFPFLQSPQIRSLKTRRSPRPGSVPGLFPPSIFWLAGAGGRLHPLPARAGLPQPPGRPGVAICSRLSLLSPPLGEEGATSSLRPGTLLLRGQPRRFVRPAEGLTKARLLPRKRPLARSLPPRPVPSRPGRVLGALRGDGEEERKRRGSGGGCLRGAHREPCSPHERTPAGQARAGRQEGKEGTLSRTKESQTSLSFFPAFYWWLLGFHLLLPPPRESTPPPPPPKKLTLALALRSGGKKGEK